MNRFFDAGTSHDSMTANGAVSHSTTGNLCLDYFSRCGTYRGRTQDEVDADMSAIFGEDEKVATAIVFFNRAVSRKLDTPDGEVPVFGSGQRDEFIKSLNWIERHRPEILAKVLDFVPLVGRWSDLWYDSTAGKYHHYVDSAAVYDLIADVLSRNDQEEVSRLAKYLPTVRSNKNGRNVERHSRIYSWVYGLCLRLRWTERQYRKFKANPNNTAHEFQRRMGNGWNNFDFSIVPGRALNKMVMSQKDPIQKHLLVREFKDFLAKKGSLPYTGYVYELGKKVRDARTAVQVEVLNKQFETLLGLADESVRNNKILPVLDTSGSMSIDMCGVQAVDIAKSVAVYLSMFTKGYFSNMVCMFDNQSTLQKLSGRFTDRYGQIPYNAMGGTNFQSVIELLVNIRATHPEIPLEEYPETLLVISDMQFNPCDRHNTNHETAVKMLQKVGLGHMSFIWWYVSDYGTKDHVVKENTAGCTVISGFDPNVINVILDKDKKHITRTPYESMMSALSQPLMKTIQQLI